MSTNSNENQKTRHALEALQRDLRHAINLEDEEEEIDNYSNLERRVQERLNFYRELGVKG